jgi:chromosome partitioning protein
MTYIIAVANQKGGVAKTTTTVSLGGAFALHGRDVLLVDLDPQADLSLALGVEPDKVRRSIADVLFSSANLLSVSRETSIPNLDLVPSNSQMDLAERFLPIRQNYETLLRSALNVNMPYDYVLLDCPPSVGAVTLNALNAANLLVIPTQPEYFSVHALRNMLTAVRRIRSSTNPDLNYRILITMQDRRNRIHRTLNEQLRATFGAGILQTVLEVDTKLRESAIAGLPITHQFPTSRGALQYQALAQELTQHVQETATQSISQQPA